jgi:hypothetical protein
MQRLPSNDSSHRVLPLSSAVSPEPASGADKSVIEPQQTADFTAESGRLTVAGRPAPARKNRRATVRRRQGMCME